MEYHPNERQISLEPSGGSNELVTLITLITASFDSTALFSGISPKYEFNKIYVTVKLIWKRDIQYIQFSGQNSRHFPNSMNYSWSSHLPHLSPHVLYRTWAWPWPIGGWTGQPHFSWGHSQWSSHASTREHWQSSCSSSLIKVDTLKREGKFAR